MYVENGDVIQLVFCYNRSEEIKSEKHENIFAKLSKGSDHMTMTEVKIQVPVDMASYAVANDAQSELMRNAMLLYPYIKNLTISHGKAAEILGIRKYELINLYDGLGLPYLTLTRIYRKLRKKHSTFRRVHLLRGWL